MPLAIFNSKFQNDNEAILKLLCESLCQPMPPKIFSSIAIQVVKVLQNAAKNNTELDLKEKLVGIMRWLQESPPTAANFARYIPRMAKSLNKIGNKIIRNVPATNLDDELAKYLSNLTLQAAKDLCGAAGNSSLKHLKDQIECLKDTITELQQAYREPQQPKQKKINHTMAWASLFIKLKEFKDGGGEENSESVKKRLTAIQQEADKYLAEVPPPYTILPHHLKSPGNSYAEMYQKQKWVITCSQNEEMEESSDEERIAATQGYVNSVTPKELTEWQITLAEEFLRGTSVFGDQRDMLTKEELGKIPRREQYQKYQQAAHSFFGDMKELRTEYEKFYSQKPRSFFTDISTSQSKIKVKNAESNLSYLEPVDIFISLIADLATPETLLPINSIIKKGKGKLVNKVTAPSLAVKFIASGGIIEEIKFPGTIEAIFESTGEGPGSPQLKVSNAVLATWYKKGGDIFMQLSETELQEIKEKAKHIREKSNHKARNEVCQLVVKKIQRKLEKVRDLAQAEEDLRKILMYQSKEVANQGKRILLQIEEILCTIPADEWRVSLLTRILQRIKEDPENNGFIARAQDILQKINNLSPSQKDIKQITNFHLRITAQYLEQLEKTSAPALLATASEKARAALMKLAEEVPVEDRPLITEALHQIAIGIQKPVEFNSEEYAELVKQITTLADTKASAPTRRAVRNTMLTVGVIFGAIAIIAFAIAFSGFSLPLILAGYAITAIAGGITLGAQIGGAMYFWQKAAEQKRERERETLVGNMDGLKASLHANNQQAVKLLQEKAAAENTTNGETTTPGENVVSTNCSSPNSGAPSSPRSIASRTSSIGSEVDSPPPEPKGANSGSSSPLSTPNSYSYGSLDNSGMNSGVNSRETTSPLPQKPSMDPDKLKEALALLEEEGKNPNCNSPCNPPAY